jgi:hypothetical protein
MRADLGGRGPDHGLSGSHRRADHESIEGELEGSSIGFWTPMLE